MKPIYLIIFMSLLLCGCIQTEEERQVETQRNATNPEKVCTMPDGRILYCITVIRPNYDHYVYYFSTNDNKTVSINNPVRQGKTSRIQTTILIDGQQYKLVPLEN